MTIPNVRTCWCALALVCASLLGSCAQDRKFEGISVSRGNNDTRAPYLYNAVGTLDFEGQDPTVKARKVMLAACPQGQPDLMVAQAARIPTETSNKSLLVAIFACNQLIPGVE